MGTESIDEKACETSMLLSTATEVEGGLQGLLVCSSQAVQLQHHLALMVMTFLLRGLVLDGRESWGTSRFQHVAMSIVDSLFCFSFRLSGLQAYWQTG